MTPVLGVSACLLGGRVRFDGGHKRHELLATSLDRFVTWVPICPETDAGLGVPREAMRVDASTGALRLIAVRSGIDHTAALRAVADRFLTSPGAATLDGFVFKKDSPSCGVWRVKTHAGGKVDTSGRGLFAAAVIAAEPLLPVEEEGRLNDPQLREHFLERVFARRRLRGIAAGSVRVSELMQFHARHKLQLLAHSPRAGAALGRAVAATTASTIDEAVDSYHRDFQRALSMPATRGRHVNVLEHVAGYFTRIISSTARRDLMIAVQEYSQAIIPLVVPIKLMAHYAKVNGVDYLLEQSYLEPYPNALRLRNHV